LGQIWTNPTIGLHSKINYKPNGWVCPYLTQTWVETTQHFIPVRSFSSQWDRKRQKKEILTLSSPPVLSPQCSESNSLGRFLRCPY